jgi:hypothetical protein
MTELIDIEKNNLYWKKYIINTLNSNANLFAEFELYLSNTFTYFNEPVKFSDNYVLKGIKKIELLKLIKEVMKTDFPEYKHFVWTRAKYDSSHMYIVVSLVH